MANTNLKYDEIALINNSTDLYDAFDPIIKKKVKDSTTLNKIIKLF